jgi:hypothetical protein
MARSIRAGVAVVLLGAFLVLKGCDDRGDDALLVPGGAQGGSQAPLQALSAGCELEPHICYALDSAISTLQNHEHPFCENLGHNARQRFNSPTGGFVPGQQTPGVLAYVWMTNDGTPPSGWSAVNDNVYVNQNNLEQHGYNLEFLAFNLVPHEEAHQQGWPPDHEPPPPPVPCI